MREFNTEEAVAYSAARAEQESHGVEDAAFDMVLCSMMLMDCEDFDGTMREVYRVLKPAGRLLVSVLHPCFDGNKEKGIWRQGEGEERHVVVMNYFEPKTWEAPLNKGTIPVVSRHRTIEDYVNTFIKSGFTIKDVNEPCATVKQAE